MSQQNVLWSGVDVLQLSTADAAPVLKQAIDLAGQMAVQMGATVFVDQHFLVADSFACRDKLALAASVDQWLDEHSHGFVLAALSTEDALPDYSRMVVLRGAPDASEATLFAQSGLADLLGDPAKAPLIPRGSYAAGTVAYGVHAALAALVAKQRRSGVSDVAEMDAVGVLSWVNWKAAAAGVMGKDICREGDQAEWPIVPCADGYVALVYQERDWPNILQMVDEPELADPKFSSFKSRAIHRDGYMRILRRWAAGLSKTQISKAFEQFEIPAAAVMTPADLLRDDLLQHRQAFRKVTRDGQAARSPRLAHRIAQVGDFVSSTTNTGDGGALPLAGLRVLDLGIITAGAGVSALLADLGAQVLKIESHSYPDPFRQWAGQAVSPLFKCNNRNKFGLALDLKDAKDKQRFLQLVADADVVVENFRRGVLDRLGLDFATLSAANPYILLASVSGQGLSGPGCGASSFGSTLEASSGFATNVSYADGIPHITGRNVNYPDQTVVLYAAAVITAALSGPRRAMHVDVSQRDVAVYLLGEALEKLSIGHDDSLPSNGQAYLSADAIWVAFDDTQADLDWPQWVQARSAQQVVAELARLGIGAAQVNTGSQMYARQAQQTPYLFDHSPDGAMVKGVPFQFRQNPMHIRLNAPAVGEHTGQFVTQI